MRFARAARIGPRARWEAWVWRAVVNAARKQAQVVKPAFGPTSASPATENGDAADARVVRAWVASLPERQRLAVFLRYYADLDYRSIAAVLEIEVGTVSATLSSAHSRSNGWSVFSSTASNRFQQRPRGDWTDVLHLAPTPLCGGAYGPCPPGVKP
jgi:Sigma-70, region 4